MESSTYSIELYPVRCFSCGKVLVGLKELRKSENIEKAMTDAGYTRICCRAIILTSVPIVTGYGNRDPKDLQKIQYLTKDKFTERSQITQEVKPQFIPSLELDSGQSLTDNLANLTLEELQKQKIHANEEESILLVKGELERTNYGYIEPISKREYYAI